MAREKSAWGSDLNSGAGSLDAVILGMPRGQEFTPEELAVEVRRRNLPVRGAVREHLVNREKRGLVERTPNGWKRIAGDDPTPIGVIRQPIAGEKRMTDQATKVDRSCFPETYLEKGDQVFLKPVTLYSWDKIVTGAQVKAASGVTRRMFAAEKSTFRGFHKLDKAGSGAMAVFVKYFAEERASLVDALLTIRTRDDLHRLSNRVCDGIRSLLSNIKPAQLRSYNKIRKPVDLYLEHLAAMAVELDNVRAELVPLLFLPLDSQILAHPGIFLDHELAMHGLTRRSTYKDITSEQAYLALQSLLSEKAGVVAAEWRRSFHPIYFDLVWNSRYRNPGGNLFETNP